MKGDGIIVNEYLLTVKTKGKNKLYKVYAPNEGIAINQFVDICRRYQRSQNIKNKEHWEQQSKAIADNNFSITLIEDFYGVREII